MPARDRLPEQEAHCYKGAHIPSKTFKYLQYLTQNEDEVTTATTVNNPGNTTSNIYYAQPAQPQPDPQPSANLQFASSVSNNFNQSSTNSSQQQSFPVSNYNPSSGSGVSALASNFTSANQYQTDKMRLNANSVSFSSNNNNNNNNSFSSPPPASPAFGPASAAFASSCSSSANYSASSQVSTSETMTMATTASSLQHGAASTTASNTSVEASSAVSSSAFKNGKQHTVEVVESSSASTATTTTTTAAAAALNNEISPSIELSVLNSSGDDGVEATSALTAAVTDGGVCLSGDATPIETSEQLFVPAATTESSSASSERIIISSSSKTITSSSSNLNQIRVTDGDRERPAEAAALPVVTSVTTNHASTTHELLEVKNGETQQHHMQHAEAYNKITVDESGKESNEGHQTSVEQHHVNPSLLLETEAVELQSVADNTQANEN